LIVSALSLDAIVRVALAHRGTRPVLGLAA
jgi:hypothetical protein